VEGFRQTVLRTTMSSGATKRRRRFTDAPQALDIAVPLTNEEVDIFIAFYQDDLADGSLNFTKTHPRLGTLEIFVFRSDVEPIISRRGDSYLLTMNLEFFQ